jgi:hypothetical protein
VLKLNQIELRSALTDQHQGAITEAIGDAILEFGIERKRHEFLLTKQQAESAS